jgi:hypothetical protein
MTSLLQRQLLLNFKTTNNNRSYNPALAACVNWLSSVERRVVAQLTRPERLRRFDQTYPTMSGKLGFARNQWNKDFDVFPFA